MSSLKSNLSSLKKKSPSWSVCRDDSSEIEKRNQWVIQLERKQRHAVNYSTAACAASICLLNVQPREGRRGALRGRWKRVTWKGFYSVSHAEASILFLIQLFKCGGGEALMSLSGCGRGLNGRGSEVRGLVSSGKRENRFCRCSCIYPFEIRREHCCFCVGGGGVRRSEVSPALGLGAPASFSWRVVNRELNW